MGLLSWAIFAHEDEALSSDTSLAPLPLYRLQLGKSCRRANQDVPRDSHV